MKLKLVDYKTKLTKVQTGTCELCYGTMTASQPLFVFQNESGVQVEVAGYYWDWGDYDEVYLDNVIDFAAWVAIQDFTDDTEFTYIWLDDLIDQYYRERRGAE